MYKPHLERKYLGKDLNQRRTKTKKRTKPITQDDINKSIEAYLKAGNKIEILFPAFKYASIDFFISS